LYITQEKIKTTKKVDFVEEIFKMS